MALLSIRIGKMKIHVHPAFLILLPVMIALNYLGQFFMLLLAVTLHELSHVAASKVFGLSPERLVCTPIGEIAVIKNIETLSLLKKIIVLAAGPCCNLFLFFAVPDRFALFKTMNLSLAFFNLLPVYPLDGGRIVQFFLANRIGVLPSNKIVMRVGSFFSKALIFLGFFQMVLFPYNLSLVLIGLYLKNETKKAQLQMAFEFYKMIAVKNKALTTAPTPVRAVVCGGETEIKALVYSINWEHYYLYHILREETVYKTVTEQALIVYVLENGLGGRAGEI